MADALDRLTAALADRYRIERELGSGGMATVYLAHDLKHDRQVAVKVLRPELAAVIGADRFLAEIRTTANLQHPHILPLFDSGQADSFLFYVMPFIDGESLRDRLNREKQLPIADAVRITTEAASALDYAHRHGVIHRDIKPENILLHDGRALVADFGIALAASKAGARMTETGMSLGTPQYMSPEQAMGERTLTPRSDVYALGCVLYEMLVGQPPSTGVTAQAIFAKVMTEKPAPIIPQRDTVPEPVEDAVLTALAKVPADRFASATEFAAALVAGPVTPRFGGRAAAGRAPRWRTVVPLIVVGIAVAAVWFGLRSRPEPFTPTIRTRLTFETSQAPVGGAGGLTLLLTPDGSKVVYGGPGNAGGQLWVQSLLDQLQPPTPIAGTEGAGVYSLAISPDGGAVAFWQKGRLGIVPLNGGSVVTLADSVPAGASLAWLDDGTIIYKPNPIGDFTLRSVSASGGASHPVPVRITGALSGLVVVVGALPHSRGVILVACQNFTSTCGASSEIWILDLRSHKAHRLLNANGAWYLPSGLLVYVSPTGGLFAQSFSLRTLEVTGTPVPILDGVQMGLDGSWDLGVAHDGTLLYRPGGTSTWRQQLVWVMRDGTESLVDSNWSMMSNDYRSWALSPNDSQVALSILTEDGSQGIWVKQLSRGALSRLTINSSTSIRPRWAPDGRSVTFIALERSDSVLRVRRSDGTGGDSVLLRWRGPVWEGFETPEWVVARVVGLRGDTAIVGHRIGPDTTIVKLVGDSGFDVTSPMLSPDGKWLAYKSNEGGRDDIYVRPFPNTDSTKIPISTDGGTSPLWAHSGRELFYLNLDGEMMVVTVGPGPPFHHEQPRMLFRLGKDIVHGADSYYTWFDLSRDDRRFLMARGTSSSQPGVVTLVFVRNWLDAVRAKMKAQ